ncbi:MAG TPA: chromosomal replication initiator protein DnaA [Caulobacteraceae bacterium]|jgi:chromosomal replication initiator protein|nr:chromosomal replication initiator protein DnaA [Caulobacteraceae bacterium]
MNTVTAIPISASVATPPAQVWVQASDVLRTEIGADAFGSWVAPAALRTAHDGRVWLVTHTGLARDWVRRHAWRRIGDLWARYDPDGRAIGLTCRHEFESDGPDSPAAANEAPAPAASARVPASYAASLAPAAEPAPSRSAMALKAGFTFETFVIGESNEFACAVSRRVASWADGHFNPVIFHGPYGFGKTHLLQALAAEASRNAPSRKVVYLTAERFMSSFVRAVMERQTAGFKEELRSADLLLIDDLQFIAGKQSTQEELFHTLASLMENDRRVVFSADRPAAALTELDARLRSHLSAGLLCAIEPADRALRLGILERKLAVLCAHHGLAPSLRPEVMAFLADRFTESVREMEGALNILIAQAGSGAAALSLEACQRLLRPHLKGGEPKRVTVDDIQKAAAEHFGLKQADLLSERRTRAVARPRQAAMWLAKQLTTRSLPDIGRRFGGRDHTTVLHAVRRIDELKAGDPQLARDLEILVRKLGG